jgi:ferritin
MKNIEHLIDTKIKKTENLLTEQISVLEDKFAEKLDNFETNYIDNIVEEQVKISENLDSCLMRVQNIEIQHKNVSKARI